MKVYFFVCVDTGLHAKYQKATGLIFIDIMKSKHWKKVHMAAYTVYATLLLCNLWLQNIVAYVTQI